jgi:glutamate synthase (NADPH/NADH) large chain
MPEPAPPRRRRSRLLDRQQAFGYTQEDLKIILAPMAKNGEEAIGSMGNDAALPVLSTGRRSSTTISSSCSRRSRIPPIDPIREELVMSLVSFIGPRPNLLAVNPDASAEPPMRLEVQQPILTPENMEKLRHADLFSGGAFRSIELDICYPAAWGANGMEAALASLAAHAEDAIHQGYNILILSDRSVSAGMLPIPALLATGAVHEHLVRQGLRTSTGLVVETGSAREVHHFALLAGYGAEAIHPYLALETLARLHEQIAEIDPDESQKRFIKADLQGPLQGDVQDGHLHVPVVLRRADLRGGRAAEEFVDKYFTARPATSRASGSSRWPRKPARLHSLAFGTDPLLANALDAGASTRIACAARSTCGRPTRSPSCSTRRARTRITRIASTRR